MSWKEANEKITQPSTKEEEVAFATPLEARLQRSRAQGYLPAIENPVQPHVQIGFKDAKKDLPPPENFDALFNIWANEALEVAAFLAEKPKQGNRIPIIVKRKVAQLSEMKICFADSKPACFRMVDSKKGEGGPYNRFTYASRLQRIYPNYEYLVQIAAFRDLVIEYGYDPSWMKFEYHESVPPVWLAVDIGIKIPDGPKIFVEVKETKSQWQSLILEVEVIGSKGVNLLAADRGDDPLRKAKYIVAGRPDYFMGYSPDGFDSYKVIYESKGQFSFRRAPIPTAKSNPPYSILDRTKNGDETKKVGFINDLLGFLEKGFQEPLRTFQYLKSRGKCSECLLGCHGVLKDFSQPSKITNPWSREGTFFNWCKEWYNRTYEEPVRAVFVNSLIAQFLASAKDMSEGEIARCFRREFRGEGRKGLKTPACIWKDRESVQIIGMACDFLLLPPLPVTVGEVKVAMPHQPISSNITKFREDLATCEEWLKSKPIEYIQKFGIERFEYGLAILIDLTGGQDIRGPWKSSIDEEDYLRRGIFARLISPILSTFGPDPLGRLDGKKAEIPIATQSSPSHEGLPSVHLNAQKQAEKFKNGSSLPKILEIALNAVLRCEESGMQQSVEIPLASWGEVHQFKKEVIFYIQNYNRQASKPIKHASPWAWRIESGGHPLTENGRKYGVEMRCSFFPKGNKL